MSWSHQYRSRIYNAWQRSARARPRRGGAGQLRTRPEVNRSWPRRSPKGEALLAMGRYAEAMQIFDGVLAANQGRRDARQRGIARIALGRLADANGDWRSQRAAAAGELGGTGLRGDAPEQSAWPSEFGLASAKEPRNLYWALYRLTAARLAGVPVDPVVFAGDDRWPALLLAFDAGRITEETLLGQANSPGRQAEARFQMGVRAAGGNPAAARRHWREVVDNGAPALIEYAAASNELARLGS